MGRTDSPALLADHMLTRLGRWLRAAGYDCAAPADGASDREVLAQAVAEGRLLLTRDFKLTEFRDAPRHVVWLRANSVAACAAEITDRLGIDWLRDPFSRCLLCNRPLEEADPARWWPPPGFGGRTEATPGSGELDPALLPLRRCPPCGRLYWRGGHARRMRAKLESWAGGTFAER